jgi:hypothetical protein
MQMMTPDGARPQGPRPTPPTPDRLEDDLVMARRMVVAVAEALAGAGGDAVAAWLHPELVAGALDTIASLATGLAGELRGEAQR